MLIDFNYMKILLKTTFELTEISTHVFSAYSFIVQTAQDKKKILVWHSYNFLLPYIIVEEYFINSTNNLSFTCFVVDELPAFIVIAG